MGERVRVGLDPQGVEAVRIRLWLLQLGAEPVDAEDATASGVPVVPQRRGIQRGEVAAFVHGLRGVATSRSDRFDDHGSAENWPRGSF
ncbi:MAG TPA: hypothetical protein PLK46_06650 [Propioniciclava sp.]|uniref:hypothetical protein n=1 Tax=Propioniciclava sp. TaxID=2038686 RepID=UPI002CB722C7|nr:hypothetical protein [Propioniciclava sp.]HRL47751.1 hypothetical protein [Propioniciclava sp.]HRL79994.1 hypothetical protein [Propioniciclava sp.]